MLRLVGAPDCSPLLSRSLGTKGGGASVSSFEGIFDQFFVNLHQGWVGEDALVEGGVGIRGQRWMCVSCRTDVPGGFHHSATRPRHTQIKVKLQQPIISLRCAHLNAVRLYAKSMSHYPLIHWPKWCV